MGLHQTRHDDATLASVDIHLELNRREDRVVYLIQRGREDGEYCCHRIGFLPGHDLQERLALLLVCALIDKRLTLRGSGQAIEKVRP